MRAIIFSFIILALILDLACYKYRRLTNFILYFEGAYGLLITLIPSAYWLELPIIWIGINYLIMFLCFYCDKGAQLNMFNPNIATGNVSNLPAIHVFRLLRNFKSL